MIDLLMDMAQIYQRMALESLSQEDMAHAKRYGMAATEIANLFEYKRVLFDLLARIHGDGGHRIERDGWLQAANDADQMVADWRASETARQGALCNSPREVPAHIIQAANAVASWFCENNIKHWRCGGVASREDLEELEGYKRERDDVLQRK